MNQTLKRLRKQAHALVTSETYGAPVKLNLDSYIEEFTAVDGRTINIEPVIELIRVATHKFHDSDPPESDSWLAPRIHAALRLYRAEAADLAMWEYLTICVTEIRDYMIWRWTNKEGKISMERVWGALRRHALARLWWAAELTRNGPDYSDTIDVCRSQDAVNYLTDTLMFNNRPAAVAFARTVKDAMAKGGNAKDAVTIGKSLNHVLVTVVLDSLVPSSGTSTDDYKPWVDESVDQTLMYNDLPIGPNEPRIPEEHITTALNLMKSKRR